MEATHFAGSPLSGPTARPIASVPPAAALAVTVRFVALEEPPAGSVPLASAARLTAAARIRDLSDPAEFAPGSTEVVDNVNVKTRSEG